MNNMNLFVFLKIAAGYLKRHMKSMAFFFLFALIFAAVFSLYNLPVEAVAYAVLLCSCTGAVLLLLDFFGYYRRHRLLAQLLDRIVLSIEGLPNPADLLEQDYQDLIKKLHQERIKSVSAADSARSDMLDYYTLWAHQIKTPIAAMGLLLQSEENARNTELLLELFKVEQYVEMVLQYLRIESTSSDYVLKHYDLDGIVREAVRKYARLFINKKIILDFSELNCEVLTDEKWLVFVIGQILSNALKYTVSGRISIYMDREENKTLVIEDTGIGIQAEDLPRVFEKGFTGYNGRTDKKSTGIGLYLCKRILTKLSHSIVIESRVGQGTKVKIGLSTVDIGL